MSVLKTILFSLLLVNAGASASDACKKSTFGAVAPDSEEKMSVLALPGAAIQQYRPTPAESTGPKCYIRECSSIMSSTSRHNWVPLRQVFGDLLKVCDCVDAQEASSSKDSIFFHLLSTGASGKSANFYVSDPRTCREKANQHAANMKNKKRS